MDPTRFLDDLLLVPETLASFAHSLDGTPRLWPVATPSRRILLVGMGSSYFAATAAASRLRSHGFDAVAELSSAELTWPPSPDLLLVAISASGSSAETLAFAERYAGTSQIIALTNGAATGPHSPLGSLASATVDMAAGVETGGVACRSFRHTLAALLALDAQLVGSTPPVEVITRAAAAAEFLLDRRDVWLPEVLHLVTTDDGIWFLAPSERWASAAQGALMVREGPRRRADACETGDWSHVDVYLTKTLDYRAVVFAGSRHEAAAAGWMHERNSTVVAVGGGFPDPTFELRYPGDDDPQVALLTEVLVAELLAATWWTGAGADQ